MSAKSVTCCCYIKNENLYYEFMGNFIFYQTYTNRLKDAEYLASRYLEDFLSNRHEIFIEKRDKCTNQKSLNVRFYFF